MEPDSGGRKGDSALRSRTQTSEQALFAEKVTTAPLREAVAGARFEAAHCAQLREKMEDLQSHPITTRQSYTESRERNEELTKENGQLREKKASWENTKGGPDVRRMNYSSSRS